MQNGGRRPGPVYHVNDISVYLGRQRGVGEVPDRKDAFRGHILRFEPRTACFLLRERSKLQKMSSTTQTAQALARWLSSEIIHIRMCVLHIQTTATIQGGPYSTQSFCLCGYYSRVASKYGMQSWYWQKCLLHSEWFCLTSTVGLFYGDVSLIVHAQCTITTSVVRAISSYLVCGKIWSVGKYNNIIIAINNSYLQLLLTYQ